MSIFVEKAEQARKKLAKRNVDEKTVAEAVEWARKRNRGKGTRG